MAYKEVYSDTDDLQCVDLNWANQLEMFKIAFEVDDLVVRYLDEENEEIGLNNQEDFEYAIKLANQSSGFIYLIFKDKSGKVMSKKKFRVNKDDAQLKQSNLVRDIQQPVKRDEWIVSYLDKFKQDVLTEMELKLKQVIQSHLKTTEKSQHSLDLFEPCESPDRDEFEKRVSNILRALAELKYVDRPMKKAYLDEELQLTGAFEAEFVTDLNMPDGSKCKPNFRFQKQWLIKNTGKIAWTNLDGSFPVQLVCTGGNIPILKSEEYVNISFTETNESRQVNVSMVSPCQVGEFYSEWALVCRGFQFGPRLWCAIEVVEEVEDDRYLELLAKPSLSEEDEFVVIPDCLNLTKKWKPENAINDIKTKNLVDDLENSYFEVSAQVAQTLNDLSTNYELIENTNLLQDEARLVIPDEKETVVEGTEDDASIEKVIISHTFDDNSTSATTTTSTTTSTFTVTESKKEYVLPEDNAPIHVSKFDMIKKSFANLKGPSNIGDTKLDFSNIPNPLPEAATSILRSNLPITSINSSVTQITNAIGSLGSLSSVYQSSVDLSEKNMETLISMGFANRTLNSRLLLKYNNNIDKVLQDLLERQF